MAHTSSGLSGRGRRFFLLTFLVYFLFQLTSLAFVPLALVHGINPIYRSDVMAMAIETPGFLVGALVRLGRIGRRAGEFSIRELEFENSRILPARLLWNPRLGGTSFDRWPGDFS